MYNTPTGPDPALYCMRYSAPADGASTPRCDTLPTPPLWRRRALWHSAPGHVFHIVRASPVGNELGGGHRGPGIGSSRNAVRRCRVRFVTARVAMQDFEDLESASSGVPGPCSPARGQRPRARCGCCGPLSRTVLRTRPCRRCIQSQLSSRGASAKPPAARLNPRASDSALPSPCDLR